MAFGLEGDQGTNQELDDLEYEGIVQQGQHLLPECHRAMRSQLAFLQGLLPPESALVQKELFDLRVAANEKTISEVGKVHHYKLQGPNKSV